MQKIEKERKFIVQNYETQIKKQKAQFEKK